MPARFVVFGDVIDDLVVRAQGEVRPDTDTDALIERREGGSAANTAAWLAAASTGPAGAEVAFVGRVGRADVARHSAALARYGVSASLTGDEVLPTGTIVVVVAGEQRTMLTDRGANVALSPDAVDDDLLEGAAAVHFTGYTVFSAAAAGGVDEHAFRALIDRAHRHGAIVSVDPSSAGYLSDFGADRFLRLVDGADVLLPNRDEARVLTGLDDAAAAARALGERFGVVAVTSGAASVRVVDRGVLSEVEVEPLASGLGEPTGAGDAFGAGFLAEWVVRHDVVAAARAGSSLAARAVAVVGGRPPLS